MSDAALALAAGLCVGLGLLALPRPRLRSAPAAPRGRSGGAGDVRVDAPLVLDLVAAVVASGAPPPAAVLAVGRLLQEAGSGAGAVLVAAAEAALGTAPPAPPEPRGEGADLLVPLHRCLALAEQTGAPVAVLVRSAADELRRRRRRRAAIAAARLGVRVVAPLGLCTLPAFALLGVVPVLLSLGRGLLG